MEFIKLTSSDNREVFILPVESITKIECEKGHPSVIHFEERTYKGNLVGSIVFVKETLEEIEKILIKKEQE